jgi:hypothetical protein
MVIIDQATLDMVGLLFKSAATWKYQTEPYYAARLVYF